MKRVFAIFKALIVSSIRSPSVIFWNIFFPVILLLILASIFSNIGKEVSFRVNLVDESTTFKNTNMDFASYISEAFKEMSTGKNAVITLESSTTQNFLNESLEKLKSGKIDAVIVIPPLFNTQIYAAVVQQKGGFNLFSKPKIEVYTLENSQTSDLAFTIISSVLESFNLKILQNSGTLSDFVSPKTEYVSKNGQNFSYIDFIVPGILVMAVMTVSIFGITDDLLVQREKKVLRKLFVAPLNKGEYFWAMILSNLAIEIVQIIILLILGLYLGAHFGLGILAILYILFAIVTTLPIGFFIASFSKTSDAGNALANIFNFLFMFLGGLFFPITGVPLAVQIVAYIIPTTYLANGLRSAMGVMSSPTPMYLNILVPLIWAIVMVIYSAKVFKWEV
ncbi:ABC transporter permease [Athalassotoga saccharophila]|uniref:ABC transporter permease n=1 Tax=Athalassotoga saccharophila TaxID=1441386 RepID=UPI001379D35F|nr:ABC transporter permease [Athalassotoga saccharophila]BBJ28572.1 putative multidrug ABC transporter permease YbhS [Athalassotoga saccharophila]